MEKRLDVSMLEPCEPMERTLQAIQALNPGDHLRVIFPREPHMLYPLLEKSGFCWRCLTLEADRYEVFIWGASDTVAEEAVTANIGICFDKQGYGPDSII